MCPFRMLTPLMLIPLTFIVSYAQADNIIRVSAPVKKVSAEQWVDTDPQISDWVDSGNIYGCASVNPDASTIEMGVSFTQTHSGCHQDQTRSIQPRVLNPSTGQIKNAGVPTTETRTLADVSYTQTATGTNEYIAATYSISPGQVNGYGAGYLRQNGGVYNFGASMQKTPNGYQTYFSVTYWSGNYSVAFGISTGSALNVSGGAKVDSSPYSSYISPYRGVRLLKSDGTVLAEYLFTDTSEVSNYIQKYLTIDAATYNFLYSNMMSVAKVKLF